MIFGVASTLLYYGLFGLIFRILIIYFPFVASSFAGWYPWIYGVVMPIIWYAIPRWIFRNLSMEKTPRKSLGLTVRHLTAVYRPEPRLWHKGYIAATAASYIVAITVMTYLSPWLGNRLVLIPALGYLLMPVLCRCLVLVWYDLFSKKALQEKGYRFDHFERLLLYQSIGAKGTSQLPRRDETGTIPGCNPDSAESLIELMSKVGGDNQREEN